MSGVFDTEELVFSYSSRQAEPSLDGVCVGVGRGVKTAILGANGAGKSTLFYHFNGVLKPISGRVLHDGTPLDYSRDALSKLRSEISVVVQNPDEQIFSATVEEDVAFGPLNMGMERDEVERRIVESLTKVGMLEYRSRPTVQLSYGQRKRVAIAGALACDPEVLILDEPTAGLDPQMSLEVLELVDQLCASGTTAIVSTHDVDLAYSWAEEIHVLNRGRLVYSGEPEPFFSDAATVSECGLVQPHTFSVNAAVESIRGNPEAPYPRTNSQLLAKMLPAGSRTGRIALVPYSGGELPEPAADGRCVGVYGFRTRTEFDRLGYPADYYFNAVECCMCDALDGRDAILYCDSEMEGAVRDTIASLEAFGHGVEAV